MLIIPEESMREGLINQYGIKGTTYASSSNGFENRTQNPIDPTTTDRWCSISTGQYTSESWGVVFKHMIYITNYTLTTQRDAPNPVAWVLEGYSYAHGWETISSITDYDADYP